MKRETAELLECASKKNSPSYRPAPVVLDHGKGVVLVDREGREYLDFLGGIAVNCLGYGDTEVAKAIQEQASKLLHVSNMFVTEPQILLMDRLTELTFADRVFLCNSGSESNEAALKLARRYQTVIKGERSRNEIVAMQMSFHGRTMGSLTATGQPKYHKGFEPLIPGFHYGTFNDLDSVKELVTKNTAAIIVEPVQGEGGVNPGTKEFLEGLRELCDESGALLIFDEVQTGIARTGSWFAYQHFGITPDILTSAKGLGGGFPIGAMLATEEVFRGFEPGSHATTYGGNPLGSAAALAVLDAIESRNLMESVRERGKELKQGLESLSKENPVIRSVRGLGLMVGAELEGDAAGKVVQRLREDENMLANTAGGTTVRFVPPLVVTSSDVEEGLKRFGRVIATVKE